MKENKNHDTPPQIKIQILKVPAGITKPLMPVKIIEVDGKKFMSVDDFTDMVARSSCVIELVRAMADRSADGVDMGSMLLTTVQHAIKLATGAAQKKPFNPLASEADRNLLSFATSTKDTDTGDTDDSPCDCPGCVAKRDAEKVSQSHRN